MAAAAFDTSKIRDFMLNKTCKLNFKNVTVLKVKKLLKSLSNSRSTGVDELDNFSVKLAADYIAQPLHHIVTLSLTQKIFSKQLEIFQGTTFTQEGGSIRQEKL